MENHVPLSSFDATDIKHLSKYPARGLDALDAGENYFFSRELEYIIPEMVSFDYGRINARKVLPIDMRAGPAAETITFRQITKVGAAKIISDYSDDIPVSNAYGEEFKGNVRSIGEYAQWSVQEIRAASMANRPLDRDKSEAAREDMLRLENQIAWTGDPDNGLGGLLTAPNIPSAAVPNGAGGNPEWDTKTGEEIVDDMNFIVNSISDNTNDVEAPDTLLLPTAQYNLAASKRMSSGTDTTALQYFINNSPYVKEVVAVNELKGAGPAGVDIMVAYQRNASKLQMNIPLDIEQFAPEIRGLTTKTLYHMRCGGVTVKKPLSVNIGESI